MSGAAIGGRALSDIQATGISRGFDRPDGRLLALQGVDLHLGAGQIGAIIGPNGSGKSTLLRIVGGLLPADSGRVAIDGQPVTGPEPRVGIVFQEPRLLPWRDALGNVTLPLELSGTAAAPRAKRGRELLRLVGVEAFAGARPHELSGGMRQRVAIARALALEPSVLLLDEPFSSLDALTRERFQVELLGLWARTRTTILLVTHSIGEAVFLADRVFVLSPRPGRVVAEVGIDLPRPRQRASLDVADVGAAAARIRAQLSDGSDTPEAAA